MDQTEDECLFYFYDPPFDDISSSDKALVITNLTSESASRAK
jgi:hypothetical protein